ncbi:MAG: hypothetical protein LN412_00075 [Candidatus Thermoplasmatota archaeon]|nr:hypothetical protein [Candidatus Thermoplasmatota archaeon]
MELSSFQLEQLAQIRRAPRVALLTNLTPNHLDRHGTFANYCAAKENIFKFQGHLVFHGVDHLRKDIRQTWDYSSPQHIIL